MDALRSPEPTEPGSLSTLITLPIKVRAVWMCWFCQNNHSKPRANVLIEQTPVGSVAVGLTCANHKLDEMQALLLAKKG